MLTQTCLTMQPDVIIRRLLTAIIDTKIVFGRSSAPRTPLGELVILPTSPSWMGMIVQFLTGSAGLANTSWDGCVWCMWVCVWRWTLCCDSCMASVSGSALTCSADCSSLSARSTYFSNSSISSNVWQQVNCTFNQQQLITRSDSERELFTRHRTCRGQRLRPLNGLPNFYYRYLC